MPFTCACFCGLNGFCGRKKKRKDALEEEEEEG
uniref:Bladder cancer associated transcript 1 n=1 Tax=Neogobius melanostomus TaxID=47308 RepID=A0A8C6WPE6_9GOBI